MSKKLLGLMLGVSLIGGGAFAGGDKAKDQQSGTQMEQTEGLGGSGQVGQYPESEAEQPYEEPIGGSGQAGQQAGQMQQDISGEIVKADKNSVFLKSDQGAVVQLKVQKDTQFSKSSPGSQQQGAQKEIKSARDLKEGQQVRASFEVKGTDNLAKSISLDEGIGGSGFEEQQPLEPSQDFEPIPAPGTEGDIGGSGSEGQVEPDLQY